MQRNWQGVAAIVIAGLVSALMARSDLPFLFIVACAALAGLAFALMTGADTREPRPMVESASELPSGFGRTLLDNIPSPLLVIDSRGRVAYANRAMRKMISRAQAGLHFSALFRAPRFIEAVNDAFNQTPVREIEFAAPIDGAERPLAAHIAQLQDITDFGEGRQVLVQITDLSSQRAHDAARTDFIANASHELRTPLASIIGYIETLQGHAKEDPEARVHFLGIMDRQAQRMQRLVEDLMSLTRIEMEAHSAPTDICDLHEIARETVGALGPLAEKSGGVLNVDMPEHAVRVAADRDQIAQVVTNLVENALKYAGPGAEVRVAAAESIPPRPNMTGIAVRDNGPGIAREHLHRLTERFYRVSAKKSKEQGGTGLGLAIVKHILARHGGELTVESEPGAGSTFTLWLPVSQNRVTR